MGGDALFRRLADEQVRLQEEALPLLHEISRAADEIETAHNRASDLFIFIAFAPDKRHFRHHHSPRFLTVGVYEE